VLCVFGCGGDRDRAKRPRMGAAAAAGADVVVVTADNLRGEDLHAIVAEVMAGIEADGRRRTSVVLDRRAAIEAAIHRAAPGDVVLVAGKGHEATIDIGGRAVPFDDRLVASEVVAACRHRGDR